MSRSRILASLFAATAILFVAGAVAVWSFPLSAPASTPPFALSGATQSSSKLPANAYRFQGKNYQMGSRIYKVGKNVSAPTPTYQLQPLYTRLARKAKVQGTAIFSVVVDAKGNVDDIRETSKPLGLGLDQSAIRTLRTWKFKPALREDRPVAVRVTVEVTFRLF